MLMNRTQVQYEHPVIQCLADVMIDHVFMVALVKRVGIGTFVIVQKQAFLELHVAEAHPLLSSMEITL